MKRRILLVTLVAFAAIGSLSFGCNRMKGSETTAAPVAEPAPAPVAEPSAPVAPEGTQPAQPEAAPSQPSQPGQ